MALTHGSGFVFLLQSAHLSFAHVSSSFGIFFGTSSGTSASSDGDQSTITLTPKEDKNAKSTFI
jgi:hypothetical protein